MGGKRDQQLSKELQQFSQDNTKADKSSLMADWQDRLDGSDPT